MQRQDFFQCHFFRELKRGNFIKGGSNFEHKNHEELHQRGEKTFSFFFLHTQPGDITTFLMIFLQLRILETQKSFVLVVTFVLFVS